MRQVTLVHWNEPECAERAAKLEALGYEVWAHWRHDQGGDLTRRLTREPPAAVVIDLRRQKTRVADLEAEGGRRRAPTDRAR